MTAQDDMEEDLMQDVFLQDDLGPTIAEHAMQCDSLFKKYIAAPEITPDPTMIDDQQARFRLWASNMDVYGPLNVSLDYRLRYSPTVVEIIHQLLDVICDTLNSLKPINEPRHSPSRKKRRMSEKGDSGVTKRAYDDDSDTDSDVDQAEENVVKITHTIGGTVTRLFRLSNAVRKSATAKRANKIGKYKLDEKTNKAIEELDEYTRCYIRFRFPLAPESLLSALVKANTLRLRRLCYQTSHRRRIGLSEQRSQTTPGTVQLPKIIERAPAVSFDPSVLSKPEATIKTPKPVGTAVVPATNATTARQTAVRALYAKSTTEVPRAKSVAVNNNLSFPPIPPTHECPYCGVIIEFKSGRDTNMWRDHVTRDVEPFVCTFAHCTDSSQHGHDPSTFETSKGWMSHLQNAHASTWECRAPSHDPIVFEQEFQYQEHSINEHDVPEAHVGTLSSAARRPVLQKISDCPFGDDFQPSEKDREKVESSTVFSSEGLRSHVAAHMKEIALLTLQKLPRENEDEAESIKSDQLSEDDGQRARYRKSMDSILGDEDLKLQEEAGENISELGEEDLSPGVEKLDLEDKDASGMTTLHHAARGGDLLLVQTLIQQGENVRSRSNDGKTALHYACLASSRSPGSMRLLLDADKAILNLGDHNGQTPLHYAAEREFIYGIRLMVEHGVDTDIIDHNGFTPYLWSVVTGSAGAVDILLEAGTDVSLTSADGKSALDWAASLGHPSIAETLLRKMPVLVPAAQVTLIEPLAEAAACGDVGTTVLLLSRGAQVSYRDRDGWSAIHWAAEEGHLEVMRELLRSGADVNAVSSYGTSSLHCAANSGHIEILNLLLRHGANSLVSTCHGWTPLHHAAFMGRSQAVQFLLDSCPLHVSHQDNHGWTPLHLAVHSRDLATITTLLRRLRTAKPYNLLDGEDRTPEDWLDLAPTSHAYKATSKLAFEKSRCCRAVTQLRLAVISNNIPMVKFFLTQGDSVNSTDSGRRTALYYAVKKGFIPIMEMLLDHGADPNILPIGRTTWEEFISDDVILLRLVQAGYTARSTDPEIIHQFRLIRHTLRGTDRPLVPDHSESHPSSTEPRTMLPAERPPPGQIKQPLLDQAASPPPARSLPRALDLPLSKSISDQRPEQLDRAKSPRSGVSSLWKRLRGQ